MMSINQKVVWAEGIYLGQQHFQLWESWRDEIEQLKLKTLIPYCYGFATYEIDEKALSYNKFSLLDSQAILPNGFFICYSGDDNCLSIDLNHEINEIYLGIPSNNFVASINGYEQKPILPTWKGQYKDYIDKYDHTRKREVLIATLQPVLLTNLDCLDSYNYLKIAEIEYSKNVLLSNSYIPACVTISASRQLKKNILSMSNTISGKLKAITSCDGDINKVIIAKLNGLKILLNHYHENDFMHPYQLYKDLIPYMGELNGLMNNLQLESKFVYKHEDCNDTFQQVQRVIDEIHFQLSNQDDVIRFNRLNDSVYIIDDFEIDTFVDKKLYLSFEMHNAEELLNESILPKVKLASMSAIEKVISSSLTGVPLSIIDDSVNLKNKGQHCFKLETNNDYWKKIVIEKNIAAYFSSDLQCLNINLLIMDS